ncbi:hypothetical protein IMSAG249_00141 [Lachnospiraceae bacterium]|nr:hypothetical protein IMSAG249_00141 [Lachnospiraceae bacterium]
MKIKMKIALMLICTLFLSACSGDLIYIGVPYHLKVLREYLHVIRSHS